MISEKNIPLKNDSTITLPASICPQHNLPYQLYCSHQSCIQSTRVCSRCQTQTQCHKSHPQKYFTQPSQVVQDLHKGISKCLQRLKQYDSRILQLQTLINYSKSKSKQQYQFMQCSIILEMKSNKQSLEKKLQKMESLYKSIQEKMKIKKYFIELSKNNGNLLAMKIKLSSVDGIKKMKEKNQYLVGNILSKSGLDQYRKMVGEFEQLRTEFQEEMGNNMTFKLGQIIKMKNTKKKMDSILKDKNDKNTKDSKKDQNNDKKVYENSLKSDKKQKAKPKTSLNFGQGILGGILGFFNI